MSVCKKDPPDRGKTDRRGHLHGRIVAELVAFQFWKRLAAGVLSGQPFRRITEEIVDVVQKGGVEWCRKRKKKAAAK